MNDLLYVILTLALFVLSAAYVEACARLVREDARTRGHEDVR